jgi:hypothetical protein
MQASGLSLAFEIAFRRRTMAKFQRRATALRRATDRAFAPPHDHNIDAGAIARRAYQHFEARGREHGRDLEDWLNAERELREARTAPLPAESKNVE